MINKLRAILHIAINKSDLKLIKRDFPLNYLIDTSSFNEYKKYGYIVLKNCISEKQINELLGIYDELKAFPDFFIKDRFQNSGRFQSREIRNFVMERIGKFSKEFLPEVFDVNIYDENTTGAFQIKPPSRVSELNPHQDAPVIDETKENGLFVWIPLTDINDKNGAIYVLPGSHLWGNHQRSLNVQWPLERHTKTLWKHMQPVYMQKGDILIWDTALIHASAPNYSSETRVAITTTLLPKNFRMVEYFKDSNTPKADVEQYQVERSFWESEDIMKRPPCPPNEFKGYEKLAFPQTISKKQLLDLIRQTEAYIQRHQ